MGLKRGGFGMRTARLVPRVPLKSDPSKPLKRSKGLTPGAPPARTGGDRGKTPQQRKRAQQLRYWADVRQVALERDQGLCVACGKPAGSVHHRAGKGAGGSRLLDVVENAVSLCGTSNADGCHGLAHQRKNTISAVLGISVPRGGDYANWPVRYSAAHGGGMWLLEPDGTRKAA